MRGKQFNRNDTVLVDRDYFNQRLGAELQSAQAAVSPAVGAIHLEMARAYQVRLTEIDVGEERTSTIMDQNVRRALI